MIIREYGSQNSQKLLFLPGAFSDYDWYLPCIEALSENWHVFAVAYDGYHEPYEQSFTSVEDQAKRILDYFEEQNIEQLDLVYGLSLGGSVANLVYAYDRVKITTLVIDAGISPYDYPYFLTRLILLRDVLGVRMMRHSKLLVKLAFPPERWLYPWEDEDSYAETLVFMKRLSNKSIRNCFHSANNYEMPELMPKNDTKIYYIYGDLEAKSRAGDIKFFRKTYPQAEFREIPNREHGELVTIGYLDFIQLIDEITK
ncbi:MAG: alpha/beta hydrolase [Eubacteriales bacterium]|nr:alpha/beta hydrolase [Eubacteriales bacterium]